MERRQSSPPVPPIAPLRQTLHVLGLDGSDAAAARAGLASRGLDGAASRPGEPCAIVAPVDGRSLAGFGSRDEQGDVLRAELRHRFHNLVSVTQSMVLQTLRDGVDVAEARGALIERLTALNGAVDILLQRSWQPGSLRTTLCDGFARHSGYHERITCEGPDIAIGANAVMALTLAMHELTTNAIKYGALSVAGGSVWLFWKIVAGDAGERLWLQWCERDGPAVRQPDRQGFGSRLVCSATSRSLGGEAELQFTPAGVTWLLTAPLERIAE